MSGWTVNRIRVTAGSSGRVRATYIQWARREVGIPAFDSRAVEQQPAGGGLPPIDPRLPFSFLSRVTWAVDGGMGEGRPHSPPLFTADAVGPVSTPSRAGGGPRHAALRLVMEVRGAVNTLPSKSVWLGAPRATTRPKWGSWCSCGATGECGALHGQSLTLRPAWRRA